MDEFRRICHSWGKDRRFFRIGSGFSAGVDSRHITPTLNWRLATGESKGRIV